MRKRTKICLYIFVVCAFVALGILGYFVLSPAGDNVRAHTRKFVTFNTVDTATCYSVGAQKVDGERSDVSLTYNVDKIYNEDMDEMYCRVQVQSAGEPIAVESYTQTVLSEDKDSGKIDCMISSYTISFFSNGETISFPDQILKSVDRDIFCSVVSEFLPELFVTDGTYIIYLSALDTDGHAITSETACSFEYRADSEEEFLRRGEYYYNGEWLDYIIDDVDELNKLVWWAVLYRQEEVSFYIKTDRINEWNINSLVISAINDYPEYDALEDNAVYATAEGKVGMLSDFEYYLDDNFTKCYTDLEDMDTSRDKDYYNLAISQRHEIDYSYSQGYIKGENAGERNFSIDQCSDEVMVYNTEQLFMVVQSGAKPSFESGKSDIAEVVYNNAREVLKSINNSDSLSDYDKLLNIYRYVCGEVVYDYVIYSYMQLKNDYSIRKFGNFSSFYLEGIFYDFGLGAHYAVCDGLSKAFCLMCRIEGIECVKVNGVVDGGNHAWNRVKMQDDEHELDGYYYVDTTWGESSCINNGQHCQVLTHMYFLFDGDLDERKTLYPYNLKSSSTQFDYYTHTKYQGNKDMYVQSDEELQDILSTHASSLTAGDTSVVEFELDSDYASDRNSKIKAFMDIAKDISAVNRNIDYFAKRAESIRNMLSKYRQMTGKESRIQTLEEQLRYITEQLALYNAEMEVLTSQRDDWLSWAGIDCSCEWLDVGSVVIFKLYA